MTYNDPTIIREMLENHGVAAGDEEADTIYVYERVTGQTCYAVFYRYKDGDMIFAPNIRWYVLLMDCSTLTDAGCLWLKMGGGKTDDAEKLLERLQAIEPRSNDPHDVGKNHMEADDLLLAYINDQKVTEAFESITDWISYAIVTPRKE